MPKKKEHRRMHVWWVEKEKGNKLQSHLQMWQWNINTTKRITSPALLSLQTPCWCLAAAVRMTLQKCCHPVPHPSLCWEGGSYPASFFPAALVSFHLLKQRPGLLAAEMQVLPWGEARCVDGEWGCDHTVSIRSWVRDWEKLGEPVGEQSLELAAVVTVVVVTDWDWDISVAFQKAGKQMQGQQGSEQKFTVTGNGKTIYFSLMFKCG